MKKIFRTFVVVIMLAIMCVPVSAEESVGNAVETIVGGYEWVDIARASSAPSDFCNLGGDSSYTATLVDLAASKGSYTLYYFATSTGKIYCKCNLVRSGTTTNTDRELTIYLYEKASATASGTLANTKVVSFTTSEATKRVSFTGLDTNKFYYIIFYNSSSTSTSSRLDISGSILVDDTYN